MAIDPAAPIRLSALSWVPEFAQGHVRDLRVRWALEEAGRDYAVELFDGRVPRPPDYLDWQPFGQVPAFHDGAVSLFESGAILLHIGNSCPVLLPVDPAGRARATAWLLAALNTVEPPVQQLAIINLFYPGEAWTDAYRPHVMAMIGTRLGQVDAALGDAEWLDGSFSIGDLMMANVLRNMDDDVLAQFPRLAAYRARAEARPAFGRALEAQLSQFENRAA